MRFVMLFLKYKGLLDALSDKKQVCTNIKLFYKIALNMLIYIRVKYF